MINWPLRTLTCARFVLIDYLRSWRYLVEILVGLVIAGLFLTPWGSFNAPQFFSVAGLFMLAQSAYTTWAIFGRGRRPEGYVVLARPLGRSGYLVGHYLASLATTIMVYLVVTLAVLLMNWLDNQLRGFFSAEEWLRGTLPLLMDAAVVSAFMTLITPLVVTAWPRLVALALLVLALSSETKLFENLGAAWIVVRLHELFSLLLLPLVAGFMLAAQRGYTADSVGILAQQSALALVLLGLALFAFGRRELILTS